MGQSNIELDIRKYSNLIYRVAFSMLNTKDDAEDIFQNVFIKFYENFDKFDNEEYKKSWLIRVTVNECKSLLRKKWFKKHEELDENMMIQKEENEVLYEVQKLPKKYQVVIYLFYYEKYKEKEIAKMIGITENGVKSRIKRAKEMLKNMLEGGFENE